MELEDFKKELNNIAQDIEKDHEEDCINYVNIGRFSALTLTYMKDASDLQVEENYEVFRYLSFLIRSINDYIKEEVDHD